MKSNKRYWNASDTLIVDEILLSKGYEKKQYYKTHILHKNGICTNHISIRGEEVECCKNDLIFDKNSEDDQLCIEIFLVLEYSNGQKSLCIETEIAGFYEVPFYFATLLYLDNGINSGLNYHYSLEELLGEINSITNAS